MRLLTFDAVALFPFAAAAQSALWAGVKPAFGKVPMIAGGNGPARTVMPRNRRLPASPAAQCVLAGNAIRWTSDSY